jgi:3-hydroxyisobutyrate dehydrogenase
MTNLRLGFIGLGTMGGKMASSLQRKGFELVVNDINEAAASPHLQAGAAWADTPRQVAEASDVVFTSLPGPVEVEAVALGEHGLRGGLRRDAVYFDLSTSSPSLIRRLHAIFAADGIHVLDAPVSGGPAGAASGKLALWVGGDQRIFEHYKPVLDAIGDQALYVGPIGAGLIAKLVHNLCGYTIQAALAEAFTMGVKAGVDPLTLWQAVRQGAIGRQRTFDRLGEHFLTNEFDPPAFALRLAHKDVTLATALARENNVPMRIASLTLEEMTEALNRGWGQRDSRVSMVLQTERAGVQIQVDPADVRRALADA